MPSVRHQSPDTLPGMTVVVTEGIYSKFEAKVLDVEGEHALVRIELRSTIIKSQVPTAILHPVEEDRPPWAQ